MLALTRTQRRPSAAPALPGAQSRQYVTASRSTGPAAGVCSATSARWASDRQWKTRSRTAQPVHPVACHESSSPSCGTTSAKAPYTVRSSAALPRVSTPLPYGRASPVGAYDRQVRLRAGARGHAGCSKCPGWWSPPTCRVMTLSRLKAFMTAIRQTRAISCSSS